MTYEELNAKIMEWAHERRIDEADPRVEFMKMAENSVNCPPPIINRSGLSWSTVLVICRLLLIFSKLVGVDHHVAVEKAYQEISSRHVRRRRPVCY